MATVVEKAQIFNSIQFVVDHSSHVTLEESNINNIIDLFRSNMPKSWLNTNQLNLESYSQNQILTYFILCESLNFCYWDSDIKWKTQHNGSWYSGSYGLFHAISKAIQNGHDLLNIEYLKNITMDELDKILRGTASIPLLQERYDIIKQLTNELNDIQNISKLLESNNDIELLNKIVTNFHNFRDVSIYKGQKIHFLKRAILLVSDLISNIPSIKAKVINNHNLPGCADHKIPQVLRHLGILRYSNQLADLVDSKRMIDHDSEMKIEIRTNMLYAIELIKDKLHQKGINMSSMQIDNAL